TRPDFIWRFMQCHGKNIRLHTVTAASEREARAMLPASRLVFVARIRVREACHV
ncbi:host cell division inhibitor Icd-like protein, partial [Escherichia coli]